MFCMPFNYELKNFESENARLTRVIEREISTEFDMKIEALENRMNEKNRVLHVAIVGSVNRALQQKPNYAGAAGGAIPKVAVTPGAMGPPLLAPPVPTGVAHGGLDAERTGDASRDKVNGQKQGAFGGGGGGSGGRIRGRSPSTKRLRGNDGTAVDVFGRSGSRPPQKKCVVGTSNNAVLTTRKMRSPPADIFVWGIHPDCYSGYHCRSC